jgi:hypothetical protein
MEARQRRESHVFRVYRVCFAMLSDFAFGDGPTLRSRSRAFRYEREAKESGGASPDFQRQNDDGHIQGIRHVT